MGYAYLSVFLFLSLFRLQSAEEERRFHPKCPGFTCGKFADLQFPFTNTTLPSHCGLLAVDDCDKDTQIIQLERKGHWYNVTNISQANEISIQDEFLSKLIYSNECKSLKEFGLPVHPYVFYQIKPNISVFNCASKLSDPSLLEHACNDSRSLYYSRNQQNLPSLPPNCSLIQLPLNPKGNYSDIFTLLTANFLVDVLVHSECWKCHYRGGDCQENNSGKFYCANVNGGNNRLVLKLGLGLGAGIGVLVIILLLSFVIFRQNIEDFLVIYIRTQEHQNIEDFLRSHGQLVLQRYNYSQVKKMTGMFKENLGQGGYGAVFKGELPNGCLVAVKLLKDLKSNGEEFINEVASISRTSHVNIVTLLGFCFEGSKRALIYEFITNGSLEKYLCKKNHSEPNNRLGWDKLFEIAVGVANGLEYLHRGCNTRILHFDIKPHNILLDENFCPKISDFGLAKICTKRESIVSMIEARGTIGYIAPEVFCRNFGGVSHKSDVYSYGMLVLDIVGGRKNICVEVDNNSEMYFPDWIYKSLTEGKVIEGLGTSNEVENEIARKLVMVSLWCILPMPSNRPTMSRVVEMLQASLESLPIPPRPNISSPSRPISILQSMTGSSTLNTITG